MSDEVRNLNLPSPFGRVYPVWHVVAKDAPVCVKGYGIGTVVIAPGESVVFRVRWRYIRVKATCQRRSHAKWTIETKESQHDEP